MRFTQRSRYVAWMVVTALLAQPLIGQRTLAKAAEVRNVVVICTAAGFKTIHLPAGLSLSDGIDQPGDQPADTPFDHQEAMADCLVCLVKALGQLEAPARPSEPLHYRYVIGDPVVDDQCDVRPIRRSALHSRAPPT